MEKTTTKEALDRLVERYKEKTGNGKCEKVVGLDPTDYAKVFGSGTEVTILEYYQEGETLEGTLINHKDEILEQAKGATHIMVQMTIAKSHNVVMEEMNELNEILSLLDDGITCVWGVEREDTTAFKVKVEIYIVK